MQKKHGYHKLLSYFIVVLAVCLIFQVRFGWQLLDITNFRWLMLWGSDRTPDFLAWEFYRITPWQFPLGIIEMYSWPNITSTGLTGSIPLLALPFKILDPIMPEVVQYFGIWLFSCYLLQGIFALALLRTFKNGNTLLSSLGAILFVLSPVLLHRTDHMNLCCHWIILFSFWIYFRKNLAPAKRFYYHLIPVGVSALAHPYLLLITIPLAFATFLKQAWINKNSSWLQAGFYFFIQILFTVFLWWINGNFVLEAGSEKGWGYKYFSANLNTFFNSMNKTMLFPGLPLAQSEQYEGFAYLGGGMLFILLLLIFYRIQRKIRFNIPRRWVPLLLISAALMLFALSNKITFFGMSATIPVPGFIESVGQTFRATGRYIWPVYYLINLALIILLLRSRIAFKLKATILVLAILLQTVDVSPLLGRQYIRHEPYDPPLNLPIWKQAANAADMFIMYPPYIRDYQRTGDFMFFAHEAFLAKIPITTGHLARFDQSKRDSFDRVINIKLDKKDLGELSSGAIISTMDHIGRFIPLAKENKVNIFHVDQYLLIVPSNLSELDSFLFEHTRFRSDTIMQENIPSFLERHRDQTVFMVSKGNSDLMRCDSFVNYMNGRGASLNDHGDHDGYIAILNKNQVIFEKHQENKFLFHTFAPGSEQEELTFIKPVYLESSGLEGLIRGKIKIEEQEYSFQKEGLNLVAVDNNFNVVEMTFFPTSYSCEQWRLNQVY